MREFLIKMAIIISISTLSITVYLVATSFIDDVATANIVRGIVTGISIAVAFDVGYAYANKKS